METGLIQQAGKRTKSIAIIRYGGKFAQTVPGATETEASQRASREATIAMMDTLGPLSATHSMFGEGSSAGYRGQIGHNPAVPRGLAINITFQEGEVLVTGAGCPLWGSNSELERTLLVGRRQESSALEPIFTQAMTTLVEPGCLKTRRHAAIRDGRSFGCGFAPLPGLRPGQAAFAQGASPQIQGHTLSMDGRSQLINGYLRRGLGEGGGGRPGRTHPEPLGSARDELRAAQSKDPPSPSTKRPRPSMRSFSQGAGGGDVNLKLTAREP